MRIYCDTGEVVEVESDCLVGSSLQSTNLHRAQLDNRDVTSANFSSSDLRAASLENTVARQANFSNAKLMAVWARGADFSGANLRACRMNCGNFEGACFVGADLTDADLDQANLVGCDFTGAVLSGATFNECKLDASTIWPDGFSLASPPRPTRIVAVEVAVVVAIVTAMALTILPAIGYAKESSAMSQQMVALLPTSAGGVVLIAVSVGAIVGGSVHCVSLCQRRWSGRTDLEP